MKKQRSGTEAFRYRDHPGASYAFRQQWNTDRSRPWYFVFIGRYAGWLLWISAAAINVAAMAGWLNIKINTTLLVIWLVVHLLYLLAIEGAAYYAPARYDTNFFIHLRIQANILFISILIGITGGLASYFWIFYSIPIVGSVLYFRTKKSYPYLLFVETVFAWLAACLAGGFIINLTNVVLFGTYVGILAVLLLLLNFMSQLHSESYEKQENYFSLLMGIIQATTTKGDPQKWIEWMLERVLSYFDAQAAAFIQVDPQNNLLTEKTVKIFERVIENSAAWERKAGLLEAASRDNEACLMTNVWKDSPWVAELEGVAAITPSTAMIVPIAIRNHQTGILVLINKNSGNFNLTDFNFLRAMAPAFGIMLEATSLTHAIESGITSLNVTEILNNIASHITKFMFVDSFFIALYDERSGLVSYEPFICRQQRMETIQRRFISDESFTNWILKTGEILNINDLQAEEERLPVKGVQHGDPTRSWLGVPLTVQQRVIGVIAIQSDQPNAFGWMDQDILSTIASQAAVAIDKARILTILENNLTEKKALYDELGVIHNISQALSCTIGYQDLLEQILVTLTETLGYESAAILRKDSQADELYIERAINYPPEVEKGTRIKIRGNRGITALAAASGALVNVGQVTQEERYIPGIQGGQSEIAIPLRVGDEILGVLDVESRQPNAFTERDERILTSVTAAASIAIDKARLLEKVNEVGQILVATSDEDEVLHLIARTGAELLNAEACSIYILQSPGWFSWEACHGLPEGIFIKGSEVEICPGESGGVISYVALKQAELILDGQGLYQHSALRPGAGHDHLSERFYSSVIAIPLMAKPVEAEQVVIGVIVAENKKGSDGAPNPLSGFSDNDMLVLRTLADYTVIALENARLAKLSSAMEEIYQVISEPQEFSEVLKHILVIMRKIIPYTTASLMLLEGGKLKIRQSQGFEPEEEARVNLFEFPLDESYPNYQVIINRAATIISDIRASKYDHFWKKAQDYCSGHIRCWMGVPLISGENLLGMLSIDDRRPGRYSRLHQELAMAFANRIAPIITTARLLRIPNKLLYVSQEITEDLDLVGVLRNIVDGAINKEGLAADAAIIYPYHPDTQQFDRPVYAGRLLQPERIMTPRSAESVVYKVLGLNQPHVAVEARGDPVLDREFVEREGIQSAIALPILFGSTSVGVMFVNYFSRHVFHYAEIKLVEIFAQFGAIGIRNARRFGAAERLAFLGPISATWSHELRNNFYNISTEVASLQRVLHKGSAIDPGLVEGILARLDKNARDLLSIVTRINIPTDESMTLVSLQEVLENVIDEQTADQPGSSPLINIQNRLENLPPVRAHERGLDFVFSELISNAARELRASGGSIHIAGWVEGDMVNIEVSDTGPGIPDGYIRDQLFKNSPVNGAQGSGLGLNFVKTVLDMYNGNIKLTNWINGATFRVILPVGTP